MWFNQLWKYLLTIYKKIIQAKGIRSILQLLLQLPSPPIWCCCHCRKDLPLSISLKRVCLHSNLRFYSKDLQLFSSHRTLARCKNCQSSPSAFGQLIRHTMLLGGTHPSMARLINDNSPNSHSTPIAHSGTPMCHSILVENGWSIAFPYMPNNPSCSLLAQLCICNV